MFIIYIVLFPISRYEGPDDATNMALLDVKMVTGWSPVERSVEKVSGDIYIYIYIYIYICYIL